MKTYNYTNLIHLAYQIIQDLKIRILRSRNVRIQMCAILCMCVCVRMCVCVCVCMRVCTNMQVSETK